jgi:hypothetical protein
MKKTSGRTLARTLGRVLLLGAGLAAVPGPLRADETTYCTRLIMSVPYTITQPGHYCLSRSVTTSIASGAAITIAADFVWLDLNNFALDATAAGPSTVATGISTYDHHHVTVRNGTVTGFMNAVLLDSAASDGNLTVEGIRADRNTLTGISVRGNAGGHVIRDNLVTNIGGTTFVNLTGVTGITLSGTATVVNNDIINVFVHQPVFPNAAYGIYFAAPPGSDYRAVAVNNRITRSTEAGITCNQPAGSEVVLRDNIVVDAPFPYQGNCTAVGTTNHP